MNNICNNKLTRPLGHMEALNYILNSGIRILRNVVVSVEFDKPSNSAFLISYLKSAHQHFMALQLKIKEVENIPYFFAAVDFSSIPCEIIAIDNDDSDILPSIIENEMNTLIDSTQYMWKYKIITLPNKNLLVLTFHHAIFDGRSIAKLLAHLDFIEGTPQKEFSAIYPAIEEYINQQALNTRISSLNIKNELHSHWKIDRPCNIEKQISQFSVINVDCIKVDALKHYCRTHEISVNNIISALTIKAISLIQHEIDEIAIHTPIDLSHHCTKETYKNEIGCFVGIVHSIIKKFKDKSILEIASIYAHEFNAALNRTNIINNLNYTQLKATLGNKCPQKTENFSGGFSVSNVGEISLDSKKIHTKVKDIHFTTSLFGGLGVFVLSILTYNNLLKATISYTSPLVSEAFIKSFIVKFQALCITLANNGISREST